MSPTEEPAAKKTAAEKTAAKKAAAEKTAAKKAAAKKPAAEKPAAKKAAAKKPAAEKTAAEKTAAKKAAAKKPAAEKTAAEKPAAEKPAGEKPAAEKTAAKKAPAKKAAAKKAAEPASVQELKVALPQEIFDVQVNIPLIHQVVVAQQAAARQGTHATKTRGEVRGGGRKPYRQKGTGRARQGSTRAPQFAGGGVVHGPQPRSYDQRTPKKMKAAALRGALSDRARADRIHVVDSLVPGDAPSTKAAVSALHGVTESGKVLVVLDRTDTVTWLSLRNVAVGAPDRGGPAQHLRRAGVRRRGLHQERLRRVRRRPADGQVGQGGRDLDGDRRRGRLHGHWGGREVSNFHKDHRDVLIAPVVSEKSYGLLDGNKYTFLVRPDANKTEIKIAVEKVFNVKVTSVNTLNRKGKTRRTVRGSGQAVRQQASDREPGRGRSHRHLRRPGLLTGE